MPERPVLIAAGGTGGHVFPALAVANALERQQIPVIWVGTDRGIESRIVPENGIELRKIKVTGLRGGGLVSRVVSLKNLFVAVMRSFSLVGNVAPQAVLGMGGYVSGPVCLAARLRGRRVVVHEQNAVAGMTNRLLSRVATRVMEAIPGTFTAKSTAVHTGNPVRQDILSVATPAQRFANRSAERRVLIIGGSQGAKALNEAVPQALARIEQSLVVRHQCGTRWVESTQSAYGGCRHEVDVSAFIDNMADAYAWADLVICRAGAMTVAELSAVGLAAVLIPFPAAVDDHQTANGKYLVEAGAAVMLSESELTVERLAVQIETLIKDRETLLNMAEKGRLCAKRDATQRVVSELLGHAHQEVA